MRRPRQRGTLKGPYERFSETRGEGVFYVLTLFSMIRDDEGATALEYAVLVTAIVLALLAGATIFGLALQDFFTNLFPL